MSCVVHVVLVCACVVCGPTLALYDYGKYAWWVEVSGEILIVARPVPVTAPVWPPGRAARGEKFIRYRAAPAPAPDSESPEPGRVLAARGAARGAAGRGTRVLVRGPRARP